MHLETGRDPGSASARRVSGAERDRPRGRFGPSHSELRKRHEKQGPQLDLFPHLYNWPNRQQSRGWAAQGYHLVAASPNDVAMVALAREAGQPLPSKCPRSNLQGAGVTELDLTRHSALKGKKSPKRTHQTPHRE